MATATPEQQKIVDGFKSLREQQQQISAEITRVEGELREHQAVLRNIEALDGDRRCYRQIGDTMVEHTAAETATVLNDIVDKFKGRIEDMNKQLVEKGVEINAYKEKHSIRFLSEQELMELQKKRIMEDIGKMGNPKEK